MENIILDTIIEIWSFTINGVWFEVHLNASEQRIITAVHKEDKTEVSNTERDLIDNWVQNINN